VPVIALHITVCTGKFGCLISKVAAGWHATDYPLSDVSCSKYTTVYYSFTTTTSDVSTLSLEGSNGLLLPDFVSEAHAHIRVILRFLTCFVAEALS
ncbi:hypothetical protein M405DRAFT_833272, partial [Rhizopogon salebrosus TDB-379]